MKNPKTIKVGLDEIAVDDATYAAANRELERVKKKHQRLRKNKINYEEKSLDEMYAETGFEPADDCDVAESSISNVMAEQIWQTVSNILNETDAFIITAYYRDKLAESEIAKTVGISQQGISKRRKKAEGQLKSVLKKYL